MRRQRFEAGDVFLVRLEDSTCCVGQVLRVTKEVLNSVACAFFYIRVSDATADVETPSESKLLAVQFVTPELLKNGTWHVIRNAPPAVDYDSYIHYEKLAAMKFVGAKIIGAGIMVDFLSACFGLRTWVDQGWGHPHYFDSLLVAPERRPTAIKRAGN
jgi:hypothetical protein